MIESNRPERIGVVLAAGLGLRLASCAKASPAKPLTSIGGVPLLVRTLRSLEVAGCRQAVIVVGHRAPLVRRAIGQLYRGPLRLHFAHNKAYELQNGLSVLCARPFVGEEFVLTMADHLLDDAILERVARAEVPPGGAALCVDFKIDSVFDLDDATKVRAKDGRIEAIGKQLKDYNCIDCGVFLCTPSLMDAIEEVARQRGDASLSEGVARLARRGLMGIIDIGDARWQDVDTPEMLREAESSFGRRASGT